ncbi:MAG: Gfo/Idh/MocA family oxidoreductase [Planctomycetes bacterium]|nr:Gfo/Idh/MocA family oxidoreductase [Planctomycetota bacterium]
MVSTRLPVRAAIIGCGVIGPTHAKALSLDGRAGFVLACDVDPAAAARLGAPRTSADWRDALDPSIDLVCVCTPHHLHAEQVVAALAAGKHVLCEKPLATTPDDVRRMVDASALAEKRGVVASGVFQHRFSPLVRRLHELVRGGDFGAVHSGDMTVRCKRTEAYYASGPWRGKWAGEGGGLMINQAIHTLDLMNWFCGRVVSVAGTVERRKVRTIEVEDWAEATVRYAPEHGSSGAVGTLRAENDLATDWQNTVTIRLAHGSFTIGNGNRLTHIEHPSAALCAELRAFDQIHLDGCKLPGKECYGDHHALQVQDVLGAIVGGRAPFVRLADAAQSAQTVLALYHSAATGGAVVTLTAPGFRRPTLALASAAAFAEQA